MAFIFKLTKFRVSTLMNICPYKEKLKEGQKNGHNGKVKHLFRICDLMGKMQ